VASNISHNSLLEKVTGQVELIFGFKNVLELSLERASLEMFEISKAENELLWFELSSEVFEC
jgi:hypothetical protein